MSVSGTINVLPDWWLIPFIFIEISILLPFAWDSFLNPITHFKTILRKGQERNTDDLRESSRIIYHGSVLGLFFAGSLALILIATLFARNDLAGQPQLQERLMKRVVWVTFWADPIWYAILWRSIPADILFTPAQWSPKLRGIVIGAPLAGAFKLVYLLGLGRDSVV